MFDPVDYRPLKELGSPGAIAKPPTHRTILARIRVAIEKLLVPKLMGLPDAAFAVLKVVNDARYGEGHEESKLPGRLRSNGLGSCKSHNRREFGFHGKFGETILAKTLVYMLPEAGLSPMMTLLVAIKSETPCELELLLFAG